MSGSVEQVGFYGLAECLLGLVQFAGLNEVQAALIRIDRF